MIQRKYFKNLYVLAIGLTLGFIAVSGAFAQSEEISLHRADQLIAEKRYDAAIKVLTEYGKQHPQEFDKVQKRLQGIVQARDEYNILTERLLDVLQTDPENVELILSLSRQVENLEIEPNPVVGDFVRRTKELALFTVNRIQLERIFEEGGTYLDRQEYPAALSVYSSGMNLYREEFYEAHYGDLVYSQVEADVQAVHQSVIDFNTVQDQVKNILSEFNTVSGQTFEFSGLDNFSRVFNAMETAVSELTLVRNRLSNAGLSLQNQSALLRRIDDSRGDASYLPFLIRLIEGRSPESSLEGMLGTMDLLWQTTRDTVLSTLVDLTNSHYRNMLSLGSQNLFVRSEQESHRVMMINDMVLKTILWENKKEGLLIPAFIVVNGEVVERNHVTSYYQHIALSESVPHIVAAQNARSVFDTMLASGFSSVEMWQDGLLVAANAISQEEQILLQFTDFEQQVNSRVTALEETGNELNELRQETNAAFDYNIYLNEARSRYNLLLASVFDEQKKSVQRRYEIANAELDARRSRRQSEFDDADRLITGISRESSGVALLSRYPSEASVILRELLQVIPEDIQSGNDLIQFYSEEAVDLRDTNEIASLQTDAETILSGLESLQRSAQGLLTQAQNMVGEANSLKLDGDRLVQAALAGMNQNDFEMARNQLRRASDQYDQSLRIQESESLRELRNNQVINYFDEINRRENAIILIQVRRLVDRAKADFNAQNFENADDALSEARALYLRTNSETSEEILYWQGLVRNALSLRSGTRIPSTAPLYSEMSQLLRDAYLSYETGNNLFNQNRRVDGTAYLNDARLKLQEVRLIFPLNEEAGILGLRIDQLIDPQFNQKFRGQLDTAFRSVIQTQSVEAYATLKNLSVINPNYPGMQNLLYQAGVAMGEIIPPPSAADIARSNQLNVSARAIIDSNVQSQFSAALAMLNEAIRLNPGNNTSAQLIDRVETLMGGNSTIMINEDKEKFNTAVREFQMGNRLVAQRLVDELLTNPRNRNSSELIQLKERIEAFL